MHLGFQPQAIENTGVRAGYGGPDAPLLVVLGHRQRSYASGFVVTL